MTFSRRALSLSGVSMVLAGAVLVACSDGGNLVAPAPELPTAPDTSRFSLQCEVDLRANTMGCGQPGAGGASRTLIVGGQNVHVTLAAANFSRTEVADPAALDTLQMDVTVRNLIGQALGVNTDGTPDVANGVRVFFYTGPTAVPSGIAEAADIDGTDVFLSSTEPFYRYPQVIQPMETSAARRWKLAHSDGATSVRFTVYVAAEIQFPNGWVDVSPAEDTLAVGETSVLTGTARDRLGRTAGVSQTLSWSVANPSIASVNASTGEVTAHEQGAAYVTVTNGTQTGTATVVVNNAPLAVADTIDALGNVTVPVDSAQGLLANDTDANGDGLLVMPGTFATARGGSVTISPDGSLEYSGPAGLEMAYDSVQYTVTDGVQSASAWLYVNVGARVWFVQPGAAAPGDGTQAAPFDAVAGVDSIASADETVYVLAGGATSVADAGITLKAGQSLVGQALAAPVQTTLNERTVVLLAPGAAPLVRRTTQGATVRLGANNTISGLNVGSSAGSAITGADFGTFAADSVSVLATGGPALDLTTGTLNVALDAVDVTGSTTHALRLVGTDGTLTATTGTVDGTFTVNGGSVAVTYPGSLSETDAALLSVSGGHTGTLAFSGDVSATGGTGLQFNAADGIYQFTGTTTLNGGDAAVNIANSDGVFAFGTSASITNPSSTALNVEGGSPEVVFAGSISANAGRPVAVTAVTGDSVVVSGAIAATGQGILVANNTGGGVRFTGSSKALSTGANPAVVLTNNTGFSTLFSGGALVIATTSGAGFQAASGGAVEVTGANNTISTGTGTAVTIDATTITGSGVTFDRVSANGAVNGIVLNNTGAVNGFQVVGDGSNTAGSGGVIQNTTGVAVQLTNTLQTGLRYLTVSGAGGVAASNFGALSVTNVAITSAGAAALNLASGSVTGTFSSVSATGAANAVSLTGVGGFFAANGGTLTGGSGAAFLLSGGDVGVVWNGSLQQANAAPLVSVGGGHNIGTITFQTGTLAASNGSGLRFDNADGTYAFSGTTQLNGGTAGVDILNGSAGAFTFGTGTSINSTAAGDTAFHVSASNPGVTYNGSMSKATTGPLVQMTNVSGGSVVFNTGTLGATAGTGLQFSNADGTVAFNGTVTLNGGDAGVDMLAGSDGSFTFGTGVAITNPTGTGFAVNNSSPTVAMRGPITKASAGRVVDITNTTAGTITFGGGEITGGATPVLTATAGEGIQLSNVDGTVNFTGNTSLTGASTGVDVVNGSDGSILFANTTTVAPTGAAEIALDVNGGTPALIYTGSITHNAGRAVSVQNVTGDSVVVTGNVSSGTAVSPTGRGILAQNNTGGTIAFTGTTKSFFTGANAAVSLANNTGASVRFAGGNLAITTTTGAGFSATGGGTLQVTGPGNMVASAGGIAVNVVNTTIGAGGASFQRVDANGGSNGIVLNTVGTGGFQVTGSGTAGSGGTIQNTTAAGISLAGVVNPVFSRMSIQNTGGSGVSGTAVTHFTFTNNTVTGSGTTSGANMSNIDFNGDGTSGTQNHLSGTVTIQGNTLSNAYAHGINIFNFAGTIDSLGISDNVITTPTAGGQHGIRVIAFGTTAAVARITRGTINNNQISNVPLGVGLQVQCANSNLAGPATQCGTLGSGTNAVRITNNLIQGQSAASRINAEGIIALVNGAGQGNFVITGNTVRYVNGTAISHSAFGNAQVTSTIAGNTIEAHNINLAQGIGLGTSYTTASGAAETPQLTSTVSNNTISQTNGSGILSVANDVNGTVKVKILNNNVAAPLGGTYGIQVRSGSAAGNNTVCARIENNTTAGGTTAGGTLLSGIGIRKQGTLAGVNTFGVHGLTPSPALNTAAETHVTGVNAASTVGANGKRVSSISGNNYEGCNLP